MVTKTFYALSVMFQQHAYFRKLLPLFMLTSVKCAEVVLDKTAVEKLESYHWTLLDSAKRDQ